MIGIPAPGLDSSPELEDNYKRCGAETGPALGAPFGKDALPNLRYRVNFTNGSERTDDPK